MDFGLSPEQQMLRDAVDRLLREHCPLDHVRKVAAIVPHALLRMQGERVLRDERQRLFADEAAALAWLAEDEAGRGCAAA